MTVMSEAGIRNTSYASDPVGNRTSFTDGRGNTTVTAYDALYRAVSITEAGLRTTTRTYAYSDANRPLIPS